MIHEEKEKKKEKKKRKKENPLAKVWDTIWVQ